MRPKKVKDVVQETAAIVIESEWLTKFGSGVIKVVSIKIDEGEDFNDGDTYESGHCTGIDCGDGDWDGDLFWMEEGKSVIIDDKRDFDNILATINDYNAEFANGSGFGSVKKQMVEAMRGFQQDLNSNIEDAIDEMDNASEMDDLITEKRNLLVKMVNSDLLPPGICPFCIKYGGPGGSPCKKCEYGKNHGICDKKFSTYMKILDARDNYVEALKKYWF